MQDALRIVDPGSITFKLNQLSEELVNFADFRFIRRKIKFVTIIVDRNLNFRVVRREKWEKLILPEWVPNQRHAINFVHMTQILVILGAFDAK